MSIGRELDPEDAERLLALYGSPLHLMDEQTLRTSIRSAREAFTGGSALVEICYPFKTNSVREVCRIAEQEGLTAEVSSAEELDLAASVGFCPDRTVYNGPGKTDESLLRAVSRGVRIHVDCLEEIERVERAACVVGRVALTGVRLDTPDGPQPWTRFGLSIEQGEALEACRRILHSPNLELVGLHGHLGTLINEPDRYAQLARRVLRFAGVVERDFGHSVKYCDFGGGFAAGASCPWTVHPEEWVASSLPEFAAAISEAVSTAGYDSSDIVIEPGRALVATSGCMLMTVTQVKRRPSATIVGVDATTSMAPTCGFQRHPLFSLDEALGRRTDPCDVYGSLCTQYDVFSMGVNLADPQTGDVLVLDETGAYSVSMSSQFIFGRPAVVLRHSNGEFEVLRERETAERLHTLDVDRRRA